MELEIERGLSERSATGEKHPNTSNELPSKNSIPQKSDLSTPFEKQYGLADDDADETLNENGEVKDEYFAAAVGEYVKRYAREFDKNIDHKIILQNNKKLSPHHTARAFYQQIFKFRIFPS